MRLYDLICETPKHDISLAVLSKQVAEYIVNVYAPTTAKKIRVTGKPINKGVDPELEYAMLMGKPIRAGHIAGYDIEDIPRCTFKVGSVKDMVTVDDDQIYRIIKNTRIYLCTFSVMDSDVQARIYLDRSNKVEASVFILSTSDSVKVLQSQLIHEFRHLMDFKMSKGKAKFFNFPNEEDMVKLSKDERAKLDSDYYKNKTEMNARYTQAIRDILDVLDEGPVKADDFKTAVDEIFNNHFLHAGTEKERKRFINRAYMLYKERNGQ